MSALALLDHLANFVLPAVFVALVLALCGRFLMPRKAGTPVLWKQVAINSIAGAIVLLAGLALSGRDGRMSTYAALVVVCGTVQWLLQRGWRR